ncbi:carbon-nitrogen hydrolase family protein [Aquisphaera insulae]|uniref:carbon-nitrogen hydrolase family protein n=1 Tax=Aquisphaera insulae TaxID=2712864 RepID=UPI0013EDB18E|nr:carbon-nitrogen hydrolase family protein [Aquisphaera insulae]
MSNLFSALGGALLAMSLVATGPGMALAGEAPLTGQAGDRPPRKVVIATAIFPNYPKYPGLESRLRELSGLIDEMAAEATKRIGGRRLDLAILPEDVVTSPVGGAGERAIRLEGPVRETFSALARKHSAYLLIPLDLAEDGPGGRTCSNAAVLFDRSGGVVGIYRKAHPVAFVGTDDLEQGITPGREFPVFDCDFGKLGVQICWDIQFARGWDELARKGAEIVAWPTASPATVLPAARALAHRYYVVSSTPRDNASVFEPTGMVGAQVLPPKRILVHELDLNFTILAWSGFLKNGEALREKFGDRVGFRYSSREDTGLFWSNDPSTTIDAMIRSIGGESLDHQVARNGRLYESGREKSQTSISVSARKGEDRLDVEGADSAPVVAVRTASGIGGLTVRRTAARWPDRLQLRLHVRGLESLRIRAGGLTLAASAEARPGGRVVVNRIDRQGREQPLGESDSLWVAIRAKGFEGIARRPGDGGHFEIDVPSAILDANPEEVGVEWVDLYR